MSRLAPEGAAGALPLEEAVQPPTRNAFRLLLAEDEPMQRRILARQLGDAGYQVETAACGEEALAKVLERRFDILITDWDMPGMDGAALCRTVREAPLEGYLYVLMVTGHTELADLVAGLEAGADDYIRKPAHEAELLARVKVGCRLLTVERSLSQAKAEVQRLSVTDAVAGTFNRRYLDQQLPREIERARRHGRPLAVVMADLDRFKSINDVHGHAQGDEVLRLFAEQTRNALRPSDWIARYGGEEFAIVLPECDRASAGAVAEKIRLGCASMPVATATSLISVTASFGVSSLGTSVQDATAAAKTLLQLADAAMYHSKKTGRDRVTVAAAPD
jgi:two-component system cell cycle response regulator